MDLIGVKSGLATAKGKNDGQKKKMFQ